jgi:hypothetical protein
VTTVSRRTFLGSAGAVAASFVPRPGAAARRPGVRELVGRVSRYVEWYDGEMTAVVAEERYHQELTSLGVGRLTRELVSEIAWLSLGGLGDAIAVRDVLEVDGGATPGEHSLRRLLEHPEAVVESMVSNLLAQSAAHNLGAESRNINFPTFPLVYVRRRHAGRSRWRVEAREGARAVLEFKERERPTIVRSAQGDHLRGHGRVWIDEASGRVERCQVRVDSLRRPFGFHGDQLHTATHESTVIFAADVAVGVWVPSRMTDMYQGGDGRETVRIAGDATYSKYRRFRTGARLVTPVEREDR